MTFERDGESMSVGEHGGAPRRPGNTLTYCRRGKAAAVATTKPSPHRPPLPDPAVNVVNDDNFVHKVLELLRPSAGGPSKIATRNGHLDDGDDESGAEDDDKDEGEEEGKRRCVKNVHELLESGGSNRFYDELDYLVSGLEDAPSDSKRRHADSRRSLLSELGLKLFAQQLSPIAASRLRSDGLLQRTIAALLPSADQDEYVCHFLTALLVIFCGSVRRLDHFIAIDPLKQLAVSLLSETPNRSLGSFADSLLISERQRRPFALPSVPKESVGDLGLWLLAKLTLSLQSTGDLPALSLASDSMLILEEYCVSQLLEEHPDKTRVSRILLILEGLLGCQISGTANLSLKLLAALISYVAAALKTPSAQTDGSDALVIAAVRILVSFSGPDSGSAILASSDELFGGILGLLDRLSSSPALTTAPEARQSDSSHDELSGLLCTLLINVVDRSSPRQSQILDQHLELVESLAARCSAPITTESQAYCGILLGILLSGTPGAAQRKLLLAQHQQLGQGVYNSFSRILNHLTQRRQMGTALREQLVALQTLYQPSL